MKAEELAEGLSGPTASKSESTSSLWLLSCLATPPLHSSSLQFNRVCAQVKWLL